MKALPLSIGRWIPGPYTVLGTDGFGLSEGRPELRDHFEVSADWIAFAALATRARHGIGEAEDALAYARERGLDLGKVDPASA
jgi:pyruvate dehydrogenase E1 component